MLKVIKRLGFTLAEVVIVIGIIGVVAEMTIPTLTSDIKTITTVVALKKAYSTLSQAFTTAVQENGTPDSWGLVAKGDSNGALNILKNLSPYLQVIKNCGTGKGCFPTGSYNLLTGAPWDDIDGGLDIAKAQLADGSSLYVYSWGNCDAAMGTSPIFQNVCGSFNIDVNGFKKPNQLGVDIFDFYITKTGIVPIGTQQELGLGSAFENSCKIKTSGSGRGCTAWVLYNGNMDYLKCADLSWDGKKTCN